MSVQKMSRHRANTIASQDFGVAAASISYVDFFTRIWVGTNRGHTSESISFVFEALGTSRALASMLLKQPARLSKALIHARHVTLGT